METLSILKKIKNLTKSTRDKQEDLNTGEVYELWELLRSRYDVYYRTQVLENHVSDQDMKMVVGHGLEILARQIKKLEELLLEYGIPLPEKPPVDVTETIKVESITDKYIYRNIFAGISSFLPIHLSAIIKTASPDIRQIVKEMFIEEIEIYDSYLEYGKLKNFLDFPPKYKR